MQIDARGSAVAPAGNVGVYAHARSRWWLEALTIVWLCWVYDAITNLAPLRLHVALGHARGILGVEQALSIDPERTLDRWLAGHHTLGLLLSDYYDNAHFVVTLGLLGWLWWRRADIYRPLRNTLVLVNVIAFVVFWRFPVAPPRMLHGFVDVVSSTHAIGSWHTGALASQANQLAAMPSLHIAWAVWCTLVALADRHARLAARARGRPPARDRFRGAVHRQPLRAGHLRRPVVLASRWRWRLRADCYESSAAASRRPTRACCAGGGLARGSRSAP